MTTETLSELYGSDVEVLRVNGRLIVIGGEDAHHCVDIADAGSQSA